MIEREIPEVIPIKGIPFLNQRNSNQLNSNNVEAEEQGRWNKDQEI